MNWNLSLRTGLDGRAFGSLRRKYLEKDERAARPIPSLRQMKGRAFTFYGHRLFSLYRQITFTPS